MEKFLIPNSQFLTLLVPHRTVRGVLDNHSEFAEPVSYLVGTGEVTRRPCSGALLDQALDLGFVPGGGRFRWGGKDVEDSVRFSEGMAQSFTDRPGDARAVECCVDVPKQGVQGAERTRRVEVVAQSLPQLAREFDDRI